MRYQKASSKLAVEHITHFYFKNDKHWIVLIIKKWNRFTYT
jgi:hypothetical protein